MARYFIRKSREDILREEIQSELQRQGVTGLDPDLQKTLDEINRELARKRHLVRGNGGKFVPKAAAESRPDIQTLEDDGSVQYIPPADTRGEVSLKCVNTDTSDLDSASIRKAKEKKR